MTVLYTNYVEVALTPAQFAAYSAIQTAPGDTVTHVELRLTAAGTTDFSAKLGGIAAYVRASEGADIITTGAGNDLLFGYGGADRFYGGAGDDLLVGDWDGVTGTDTLYGGAGADGLLGGLGNDLLYGGDGDDDFLYSEANGGRDSLFGGAGWDRLWVDDLFENGFRVVAFNRLILNAAASVEELRLTTEDDGTHCAISGTTAADLFDLSGVLMRSFESQDGADSSFIDLRAGNDTFTGSQDTDSVRGGLGADSLLGSGGDDSLDGGIGADVMKGGAGNDRYYVDNTGDVVFEATGSGADTVFSTVALTLSGAVEHLTALGSAGLALTGNFIGNQLTGNGGGNRLEGRAGNDTLTGGAGRDIFIFRDTPSTANADVITDFLSADDNIELSSTVFAMGTGVLKYNYFKVIGNGRVIDADDRLIYYQSTGELYYDADALGAGAGKLVATFTNHATLWYSDFILV